MPEGTRIELIYIRTDFYKIMEEHFERVDGTGKSHLILE